MEFTRREFEKLFKQFPLTQKGKEILKQKPFIKTQAISYADELHIKYKKQYCVVQYKIYEEGSYSIVGINYANNNLDKFNIIHITI